MCQDTVTMISFSRFNSIYALTDYFDSERKCRKAVFESRWRKDDVVCPFFGRHHCYVRKWFIAMYLIITHKKDISSVQLATDIDVTKKTAWHILHKVRTLFRQNEDIVLKGVVECDEMYFGGRETNKTNLLNMHMVSWDTALLCPL